MATTIRVKRLATSATNPRTVSRKRKASASGPKKVRVVAKSSHRPRTVKRSPNPAWVVTLGPAINPRRRTKTMAAAKRKTAKRKVTAHRKTKRRVVAKNTHRPRTKVRTRTKTVIKYRTRKSNPKVVVRYRTKKRNTHRKVARKKNPDLFGSRLGSKDSVMLIGGGIVGVAATKFLPTLLPASTLAGVASSSIGKTAISAAAAFASGYLATRFVSQRFGQGVYFGGFMQTASVALNAFVPTLYSKLNLGMGDFVPGQFAVPQNPMRPQLAAPAHAMAPSGSRVTMSGLARAYAPAY
jgi:hypothetical protein